ncbi:MAG TPA: cation:proton antiporter [Propionibacteriaceae bacterium]|nr:cation:proton antiporter [Propionibacteriaceae bacterium]
MSDTARYALLLATVSAVALGAVLVNRLSARLRVPAPIWMLVAAAIAVQLIPGMPSPSDTLVVEVVTVALVLILFDGGRHIGWSRLRPALVPIIVVGVLGTFLTAAGGSVLLHLGFGMAWYVALLVATAVSPTDPAVVFSVLGRQEITGRSGTILEGESGANDPVGIALMGGLLAAGGLTGAAFGTIALEFVLQMAIGLATGLAGGVALLAFMRRVTLPSEALYPLRTLASVLLLYGVTTLLHGSGFLAVFVAGIVIGGRRAPYQGEIARFHAALAGLAEIVAFVALGLTIDLTVLARTDVWLPGLILGLALAIVIRPLVVGLCLLPAELERGERAFVLFAGLKGAVPILLGLLLLTADVPDAERLYGIVVIVVIFSVAVQGSLVPTVARRLGVPMQPIRPGPWAVGVQLQTEPDSAYQVAVAPGSVVDGRTVADIADLAGNVWISMVVRDGALLPVRGATRLRAGDLVTLLIDEDSSHEVAMFNKPGGAER